MAGTSLWALCEVRLVGFCTNELSVPYEDCLPAVGGSSMSRRGGGPHRPPSPPALDPMLLGLSGAGQWRKLSEINMNSEC